jgi:alpha-1,2-mannosyltransferase
MVVAVVLRTFPWWLSHNFLGVLEYDDGVYYAASKLLLHGQVPYSDFTIVHPPLLTIALLPAALVGNLLGDPAGMAAGRVEMQLVALANMVLIYRLALRLPSAEGRARRAALVAAGLYAFMPNAVIAEHTMLLEPLVTLACLLGVLLLLNGGSVRSGLAGGCFAAGIGLKLFAGVYVVGAVVYLLSSRRPRALVSLAVGLAAGGVVLIGPFFAPAPRAAWHDIVVTQLGRPENPKVAQGLDRVTSMVGLGYATVPLGLALLAALAVVLLGQPRSPQVAMWAIVLTLGGIAFATSPTYFAHYGAFLAPAVVLLCSRLAAQPRQTSRLALVPLVTLGGFALAFATGSVADEAHQKGQADFGAVGSLVPKGSCVYYDAISLALAADVYRVPSPDCPSYVDGRGVALTQNTGWPNRVSFYPAGFVSDARWQEANLEQMRHADFLLLRYEPASFPEWATATREYVLTHFAAVTQSRSGRQPFAFWERVRPG